MSPRLKGREAIEYARKHGLTLSAHASPVSDARDGLSPWEAEMFMCEDPALIYLWPSGGPASLDELLEGLRAGAVNCRLDDLPAFGGEEPRDTVGVWSWDAERLLVGLCVADFRIVSRADFDGLRRPVLR